MEERKFKVNEDEDIGIPVIADNLYGHDFFSEMEMIKKFGKKEEKWNPRSFIFVVDNWRELCVL